MKSQFVTYEIALALKELRFDEECLGYYLRKKFYFGSNKSGLASSIGKNLRNASWCGTLFMKDLDPDSFYSAPLWQQVIDWFREKYDIIIDIAKIHCETDNYHFALNLMWEYFEGTYYEAREQAILKAIELCKQ